MRGFQRERHAGPRHEHEEETPDQAAADVEGRLASGIVPGVAGPAGGDAGPSASELAYADAEHVGAAIATLPGARQSKALEGVHRARGGEFAAEAAHAVPRAAERTGKD